MNNRPTTPAATQQPSRVQTPRPVLTAPPGGRGVISSLAMMEQWVRKALGIQQTYRRHDKEAYEFMMNQIRNPGTPAVLAGWMTALSKSASDLNQDERELLHVIFRMDFTMDQAVQDAYLNLLLDLATSHSTYVPQMVRILLPHIFPKRICAGGPYDCDKSDRVLKGVIHTLEELLRLVPLSSGTMWQAIVDMYPHRRHDGASQLAWLGASLAICRHSPGIREPILGTIVNHLLQMDVEIRLDAVAEDDIVDSDTFFKLELESISPAPGAQPAPVTPARTVSPAAAKAKSENAELADKLDSLMVKMFEYVDECLAVSNPARREEFQLFLNHFLHYVLPTHRSKFVQFLMFRACSHSPSDFSESLLSDLMRHARDDVTTGGPRSINNGPSTSTSPTPTTTTNPSPATITPTPWVTRIAACGYVASFLARANFVPIETVGRYLTEMIALAGSCAVSAQQSAMLLQQQRQRITSGGGNGNVYAYQQNLQQTAALDSSSAHAELFYAAIQAAMYIFCFWHKELLHYAKEHGVEPKQWLASLGFEQAVASPLAPLKNCSQTVCLEFETIWTSLTGISLSRYSSGHGGGAFAGCSGGHGVSSSSSSLETFFPYDPYILTQSARFVDPLFNDWKSADDEDGNDPINNNQGDDEEGKEEIKKEKGDDDDEEDEDGGGAIPIASRVGSWTGTPMSLTGAMSGSHTLQTIMNNSNSTATNTTTATAMSQISTEANFRFHFDF